MEVKLTGKNIELTPELRRYVERTLGKMDRYLPEITEVMVEITAEGTKSPEDRYVVEVTLDADGTLLRGEERGENLLEAIDKVHDVVRRQIERYKGKRLARKGGAAPVSGEVGAAQGLQEIGEAGKAQLVKVKQFTVKPMPVEEAIEQMELLGHDFFIFFDMDTQSYSLIYRRRNGGYGLIRPVLG